MPTTKKVQRYKTRQKHCPLFEVHKGIVAFFLLLCTIIPQKIIVELFIYILMLSLFDKRVNKISLSFFQNDIAFFSIWIYNHIDNSNTAL